MRSRTPYGAALSACALILASTSVAAAATIAVPAGGDLQAALNAQQPGLGQTRGSALQRGDTTVVNSYVAEGKAIGQASQAISGYNGPGPYLIENNYLEGATENFLLGGADPTIPNLVTTNVTFRHNYL